MTDSRETAESIREGFLPVGIVGKEMVHGDPAVDRQIRGVLYEICAITDVDKAIEHVRARLSGKIPDGNLALLEHVVKTRIEGYKARRGEIVPGLHSFMYGGF